MKGERARILIVEDEESLRHVLSLSLQRAGYGVRAVENAAEALSCVSSYAPLVILCDIRMPGELDGLGLLTQLRKDGCKAHIVMMSAYGSREQALEAVRRGAYDYIEKPIQREELLFLLDKLLERERLQEEGERLRAENRRLRDALGAEEEGLIAKTPKMRELLVVARKAAAYPTTILLQGESGTGKEILARTIHRWSERAKGAWVAVNCGSIPEALLESELFGYAKGAFTGAHGERMGLFEAAHGGTLFLDEIGEMPLVLQVKLLRVLQEGKLRRLGETALRSVDVRVIAASNRDLQEEMEKGRFRQDLFYRLQVVTLTLPPLRERLADLPLLADAFLAELNQRLGTKIQGIALEALKVLLAYGWPGNIRELRNVIERAMILCEGDRILPEHLPASLREHHPLELPTLWTPDAQAFSLKKASRQLEELYIRRALEETRGNRTAAAKLLEISQRALLYKIKEYEIGEN